MKNTMNIPSIKSIDNTLRLYYSHSELGNKEIIELFGKLSGATLARMKKVVSIKMGEQEVVSYGRNKVNTVIAYKAWGIDVKDLEMRLKKLKELNLLNHEKAS